MVMVLLVLVIDSCTVAVAVGIKVHQPFACLGSAAYTADAIRQSVYLPSTVIGILIIGILIVKKSRWLRLNQ